MASGPGPKAPLAPRSPGQVLRRRMDRVRWLQIAVLVVVVVGIVWVLWSIMPGPPYVAYNPTTAINPSPPRGVGTCGSSATTYNLSLDPSRTLTTAVFGAKLLTPQEALVPTGAPPNPDQFGSGCIPSSPSAWYAVLWTATGLVEATFANTTANGGWTGVGDSNLPAAVVPGDVFEVIVGPGVLSPGNDTLQFYALGSSSVAGSAKL